MKIIALMAPENRAGKTTFAKALVDEMREQGLKAARIAFADELKTQCVNRLSFSPDVRNMLRDIDQTDAKDSPMKSLCIDKVFDIEYRHFLGERYKDVEEPRSWRWHCIAFGTEFMREHKEDQLVWIRKVFDKILLLNSQGYDYVVIDDLRTDAEAHALELFETIFIEINRENPVQEAVGSICRGLSERVGNKVLQLYFGDVERVQSCAKEWAAYFKVENDEQATQV